MHLDTGRGRDVGSGDVTGAGLAEVHRDRLVVLGGDDETLEIQDHFGDVLANTLDGGELVQNGVDLDAGDRCARNRRQERTTKRVAEGVTKTRLQRLDDEPRAEIINDVFGQCGALSNKHRCFLPEPFRYLKGTNDEAWTDTAALAGKVRRRAPAVSYFLE